MRAGAARFVARFLMALALTGGLVGTGVVWVHRTVRGEIDRIPRIDVATAPAPPGGANYLLVGSDSREFVRTDDDAATFGDPGSETGRRSDTMMVVHVDPDAGRTLIVSFPRDLWVDIPGIGKAKINAAYNADLGGGPDAIVAALERNFDIDINHYVEVDFETFESMVDSVGPIPLYLDRPVVDEYTGFFAVKAGCYHLDGTEALAWVRSRHLRSYDAVTGQLEEDPRADIGRIERQQDFIRRLAALVVETSLAHPFKARGIVRDLVDDLRVDRGFDTAAAFDLVEAFRSLNRGDTSALEFVTFPFTEGRADGQSVLFPDTDSAAPLLARLRSFDDVAPTTTLQPSDVRVRVHNGTGQPGLARKVMDELVDAGFVRGGTGNDERGRVPVTEVRYANGAQDKARLLLAHVGAGTKIVGDPALDEVDVVLVIGADFDGLQQSGSAPTTGAPASGPPPSDTAAAAAAACR